MTTDTLAAVLAAGRVLGDGRVRASPSSPSRSTSPAARARRVAAQPRRPGGIRRLVHRRHRRARRRPRRPPPSTCPPAAGPCASRSPSPCSGSRCTSAPTCSAASPPDRVPWANMYEFAITGTGVIVGVFLLVRIWQRPALPRRLHHRPRARCCSASRPSTSTSASCRCRPPLQSAWLVIHVFVAILGTGFFAVGAGLSIVQLLQARREPARAERPRVPAHASRPPTRLENLAYRVNVVGFVFWTFTLIAGAIWAEHAWGRYWGWDTKEVWTFIIWVVFAGYIHARATRGWRGSRSAWLAIIGFAAVLFNFAVVNVFFKGLHAYSRPLATRTRATLLSPAVEVQNVRQSPRRRCRAHQRGALAAEPPARGSAAQQRRAAPVTASRGARRCAPSTGSERLVRHVGGEQRGGAEPAVEVELGQRGREVRAHREPDRGVEGARDDHRQPRLGDDVAARAATPPSGCAFTTSRSAAPARATASGSSALRTLSSAAIGMRQVVQPFAQLGELVDGGARLLDVLEVERRRGRAQRVLGLVDVPAAVRVDADAALRPEDARAPPAPGRRRRRASRPARRPSPSRCGSRGTGRGPRRLRSTGTAGTVAFTGMRSRCTGGGVAPSRSRSRRRARRPPPRRRTRGRARTRSSRPARAAASASRIGDAAEPGHERQRDDVRIGEQVIDVDRHPLIIASATRNGERDRWGGSARRNG